MYDPTLGTEQLIVPAGALPGTARFVIGPLIPPELQAYYTAAPACGPVAAAILGYANGDDYNYIAQLTNFDILAVGSVVGGTVADVFSIAGNVLRTGTLSNSTSWQFGPQTTVSFAGAASIAAAGTLAVDGAATIAGTLAVPGAATVTAPGLLTILGGFRIDGKVQGRGMFRRLDSIANSAAIGIGEAAVFTLPAFTYQANTAYSAEWKATTSSSAAGNMVTRIRATSTVGQLLEVFEYPFAAAEARTFNERTIFKVGAADVVGRVLMLTAQYAGGTITHIGNATAVRYFEITNIGAAIDYTNAPILL